MEKIIEAMFRLKAVEINTEALFTWASGIESPIYCDQRLLLSDVLARKEIVSAFHKAILLDALDDVDAFVGTATSGIPWASFLAMKMDKPLLYVRSSAKKHGQAKQIEGAYREGMRVVVFEDLISTGGSVLQVCESLREAGLRVEKVYANFSYGFDRAKKAFEQAEIDYQALVSIHDILAFAEKEASLRPNQILKVKKFLKEQ